MSPGFGVVLFLFLAAYGLVAISAWRRPFLRRLAVREALRRRGQTVVVVFGLMIGTATITAALVGGDSVSDSVVDAFAYRSWGHVDLTVSSNEGFFPRSVADRLAASPEVRAVTDGVSAGVDLVGSAGDLDARQGSSRVTIAGFDPATQPPFGAYTTADGRRTFGDDLRADQVLVSRVLADKIDAEPGHRLRVSLVVEGRPVQAVVRIAGVARAEGPGAYTLGAAVFATLETMEKFTGSNEINVVRMSAPGGIRDSIEAADEALPVVKRAVETVRGDVPLVASGVKSAEAQDTKDGTSFIRAMLLGMSALVLAAGAALIVNLIGMLAEERRSRLGVLRALGLTRRRLISLSMIEGALYSLAAGAVGVLLGIGIGRIIAERFARAFAEFAGEDFDFQFFFALKPQTLLTGFAVGAFLTLGVVFFASRRTSRMTITAAIRDLPEPSPARRRGWARIVRLVAFTLLGILGLMSGESFFRIVGGLAVLLVLQSLVRPRLSQRLHASLLGIALAGWAFFSIANENPNEDAGAFFSTFVVAMLSAVFGLTILVSAHLHLLERLVGLLGRASTRTRAVLRPPLAFLARRPTRTGLTTGVFAVVIGMLALFAVFFVIFRPDYVEYSNGYDVRVLSTGTDDVAVPDAVAPKVARSVTIPTLGYIGSVRSEDQFSNSERVFLPLFGVAQGSADSPPARLIERSKKYASDKEAWAAVVRDPKIVITNFSTVDGTLTLQGDDGPVTFTVAGIQPFGMLDGMFASEAALKPFVRAPRGAVVLLDLNDQSEAGTVARDVEAALFEKGVDADSVAELLDDADRANRAFFSTIDILMRMGLVVGILALGIVALRVVIERRHIIGVLRALGYKRRSVMAGLMAEATVTVAIGALVGMVVGVTMGWIFYRQQETQPGFGIDVASIGGILAIVFVAVLLVTAGPAWRASRLPPAEAVRYSE